jgi:sodium transport system permease protein
MRWSIIRLIWLREVRDQLRDRRTILMMAVLPLLLYPALGFGVIQFALSYAGKANVIGIYGGENLTGRQQTAALTTAATLALAPLPGGHGIDKIAAGFALDAAKSGRSSDRPDGVPIAAVAAWCVAAPGGLRPGIERFASAAALAQLNLSSCNSSPPSLLIFVDGKPRFDSAFVDVPREPAQFRVRLLDWAGPGVAAGGNLLSPQLDWSEAVDRTPLDSKQVDVLLIVPPGFWERLEAEERPALYVLAREGDDRSRLAASRLHAVLARWKRDIKELRFAQHGLSLSLDDPVQVRDNDKSKSIEKRAAEELFDVLVRVFPFVLVMWALAGALYPAVDLCAGEKERGTMETLLISPASREEIVWGKFLAIWVFSAATALLNLASMGLTTAFLGTTLPQTVLSPLAVAWSVVLVLPLSAFFSAVCLAIGAYARSSKEGQYYLMPLFLVTMPLIFLTLAPGVELSPFYSLVPVTGVALLLQKLMTASALGQVPWLYFVPVLAPMVLYGWLALRWAIEQFKREEVLFREAERLDLGLWLRRLLREKERLPTTGQALVCFGLIVALHWASVGMGGQLSILSRGGIGLLAFVAAPTLFMALLLTTRPAAALGLNSVSMRSLGLAALLAIVLLLPLSELTVYVLERFPSVMELMAEHNALTTELRALVRTGSPRMQVESVLEYALVLIILPAFTEELAFRGFILTGLRRRFQPWMAILLSSCLFALYHFNAFQLVPAFVLGLVLGTLTLRSGSVFPAMLFHLMHNGLLIGLVLLEAQGLTPGDVPATSMPRLALVLACSCLAVLILRRLALQPAFPGQNGAQAPASVLSATMLLSEPRP